MPPRKPKGKKSQDAVSSELPKVEDLVHHEATPKQLAKALKENPKGVYVIEPAATSFETPSPICVGYLRLTHTSQFWDLMESGNAIYDSLEDFQNKNRQYGFHVSTSVAKSKQPDKDDSGEAPKHNVQVKVKDIFKAIMSQDPELESLLGSSLPLPSDTEKLTSKSTTRAVWSYVVQMYTNMETLPHLFDSNQDPPAPQSPESPEAVVRFGFSMEDWHRSYVWIRTHQKSVHNAARNTGTGTKHAKAAIIPAFITEDDTRGIQDEADKKTATVDLHMQKISQTASEMDNLFDGGLSSDSDPEEEKEDAQTRKDKRFSGIESRLLKSGEKDPQKKRAEMHEKDLVEQLQLIRGRCKVKFENPSGTEPVEKVKQITDQSLVETETFGPDEEENKEELEQRRKEFWERNRQLNQAFAPRLGYRKACKLLQLDPEQPQLKGTNVVLKPWQPEAVAYMHQMVCTV
jgi:hypothetical protein